MAVDWTLAGSVFETIGLLALAGSIYAGFVFHFYKRMSKRLLLEYKRPPHTGFRAFLANAGHALAYFFVSPFILFLYGMVLGVLIFLLASSFSATEALYAAFALLATIRICAYFSQDLAQDVGKLLPFSFLAVVLFDTSKIELGAFYGKLQEISQHWEAAVYAFAFVIILELVLRVGYAILASEKS